MLNKIITFDTLEDENGRSRSIFFTTIFFLCMSRELEHWTVYALACSGSSGNEIILARTVNSL